MNVRRTDRKYALDKMPWGGVKSEPKQIEEERLKQHYIQEQTDKCVKKTG